MKEDNVTTELATPGQAAQYLEKIITGLDWGVINVSLRELDQCAGYFKKDWDKEIAEEFTVILLKSQNKIHDSFDMITSLSHDSFLIITHLDKIKLWEDELHHQFNALIEKKIPGTLVDGHNVVVIADEVFPVPSLVFGIVTPVDKTFTKPVDVYQTSLDNRKKNQRAALWFQHGSLRLNRTQLSEELALLEIDPALHARISEFSKISTGHLHDIRNGLNILAEQYLGLVIPAKKRNEIEYATHSMNLILEIISEIRFRGTGNLEKTDIHKLVSNKKESLQFSIDHPLHFTDIDQTVLVYSHPQHLELALYALLCFFTIIIKDKTPVTIGCGISETSGFIEVKSDLQVDVTTIVSGDPGSYNTDEYWPYLYIFKKIIQRLGGSIEINPKSIFIFLPLYEYQDKLSLHSIHKKNGELAKEIDTMTPILSNKASMENDTTIVTRTMELVESILQKLYSAIEGYSKIVSGITDTTGKNASIVEILLAGSRYCILLTGNLLALKGQYIKTTEKTSMKKVFHLVRSILSYRLSQIAEYEISIPETIPDVHATEIALAQVIMNLVMNSLEELSRAKPPIPRLFINAKEENNRVIIEITDTGTGIPGKIIERVMENKPEFSEKINQGIGLYVVKSIIDLFEGKLEFKVNPEKGTTVKIYLRKWGAAE
ncbi:MAG: hypothetical protein JXJ04_15340 [Spirochaetales bacterium]|nr:hypothetical protein [Spirochaetales bacterium]